LGPEIIDQVNIFWTGSARRKLTSPANWNEAALRALKWPEDVQQWMIDCKCAFNAKPDMLIISGKCAAMIEAKVESGFSTNQRLIQKVICGLVTKLVPAFQNIWICDIELTKRDARRSEFAMFGTPMTGFSWRDVVEMLEDVEIDEFTKRCLNQLCRYYPRQDSSEDLPEVPDAHDPEDTDNP
jgi:hypothetical protein